MELSLQLFSYILLVVAALVPIANPFSTAPLFVTLTAGADEKLRKHIALLCCLYMFGLLVLFLLLGTVVLNFFGISLPALRIAGGLIVATIGFRMVFEQKDKEPESPEVSHDSLTKVAFTPLAMPMLSGPGSISVVMSMAAQISLLEPVTSKLIAYAVVTTGIAIASIICWLVLRASGSVVRFLGKNGIDALTKVMGFLLVSIGVEFVVAGLKGLNVIPN